MNFLIPIAFARRLCAMGGVFFNCGAGNFYMQGCAKKLRLLTLKIRYAIGLKARKYDSG